MVKVQGIKDATHDREAVRSFLIGTLLGDCSVSKHHTYQWRWGNVDRQYVEWKSSFVRKALRMPCRVTREEDLSCTDGAMHLFSAASRKGRLRVYAEWFHDSSWTKRITRKIQHLTHPIGLVALLLDQGSCRGGLTRNHHNGNAYYRKPSVRFHLNAHSEPELMLFQGALWKNFGLESTLQRKAKGHLDVYLGTKATQEFWTQVRPYCPDLTIVQRKLHPLISQTTNAHLVQRSRGIEIGGSESCSA